MSQRNHPTTVITFNHEWMDAAGHMTKLYGSDYLESINVSPLFGSAIGTYTHTRGRDDDSQIMTGHQELLRFLITKHRIVQELPRDRVAIIVDDHMHIHTGTLDKQGSRLESYRCFIDKATGSHQWWLTGQLEFRRTYTHVAKYIPATYEGLIFSLNHVLRQAWSLHLTANDRPYPTTLQSPLATHAPTSDIAADLKRSERLSDWLRQSPTEEWWDLWIEVMNAVEDWSAERTADMPPRTQADYDARRTGIEMYQSRAQLMMILGVKGPPARLTQAEYDARRAQLEQAGRLPSS
jgi:hypothetical protein